ncbi:MAG: polyprenyl synthetase family protein, partial [Propionibacteriales bacterium]|nr:polyprenyl synthetase family protein [Propionibacteriales bacterium]
RELLSQPLVDDGLHTEALTLLRAHPAMDEARAYVRAEADAARAMLSTLPAGSARAALEELCDTVVTRLG